MPSLVKTGPLIAENKIFKSCLYFQSIAVKLIIISPLVKVANFTTITTTDNGHILIRKALDSGKLRDYIPKDFWL